MKRSVILLLLASFFAFQACDDDNGTGADSGELEPVLVENIPADPFVGFDPISGRPIGSGEISYYSLTENRLLTEADSNTTRWDLAFQGTNIYINSGVSGPGTAVAQIIEIPFEELVEAPAQGYVSDTENSLAIPAGSGNGWYNYSGENPARLRVVDPIPGRTIVLRTNQETYAKVEILSYYEGRPDTNTEEFLNLETRPRERFYSFQFVIQPDGSRNF